MIRTQVQLSEEQVEKLRYTAQQQGVSISEVVRQLIDRNVASGAGFRADLYTRAARWRGAFEDPEGATDVSLEHDLYLGELPR